MSCGSRPAAEQHSDPQVQPRQSGPDAHAVRPRPVGTPVPSTPALRWRAPHPAAGGEYCGLEKPTTSEEGQAVPIATPEIYNQMLDSAKSGEYAYPAINCTSSETVNAALRGFAEAGSDGIIQFSTGGAEFGSGHPGQGHGHRRHRAGRVRPRRGREVPDQRRAAHRPLPEGQARHLRPAADRASSRERVDRGENPLFQSHMWDGSAVPLDENLKIAADLLEQAAKARIVLEIEIGVVGGEEDGVAHEINEKLYTTPARLRGHRATRWASARRAATCWPRRSATCTASTSRATSSCARRS